MHFLNERKLDSQTLFYFCFGAWYVTEIIFKSTLSLPAIENYVTFFISFLLFIQIVVFQIYETEEIGIIVPISILVLVITITSQEFYILSSWLFIVAFKDADLDHVVRLAFKSLTFGIIAVIGLWAIGVIPEKITYRGLIVRHSLGFSHPNQLGFAIFQWILCYFYIRWEKIRLADIMVSGVLAFFVHKVADSQTAVACILIVALFVIAVKILDYANLSYQAMLSRVCSIGSLVFMTGSLILMWIDVKQNLILKAFDFFLSSRFSVCHQILKLYGSSLFGQRVYVGNAARTMLGITFNTYMDNAYATLWLRFGIVFAVFFIIAYRLQYREFRQVPKVIMILFVFSIYGIMESGLYQLYHNIFVLLFAFLLYKNKPWPESFFESEWSEEGAAEHELQSGMSL